MLSKDTVYFWIEWRAIHRIAPTDTAIVGIVVLAVANSCLARIVSA